MPSSNPQTVADVVMDTTYLSSSFGVMAFLNQLNGTVGHIQFTGHETVESYKVGLKKNQNKGLVFKVLIPTALAGWKNRILIFPFSLVSFTGRKQLETI
ncbi:hypothetical protein [Neisseria iguanae]|uniref:Uncharacterized protein n=1 Tax=Neisseria iguanae TaxID=90242 RepID=A0A2P7U0M9_9NEIS|nr:hypothetical protein [Neisseria iguanae]PSJ80495.1 hypothetical protein C7N83_06025 [Neisseria iguanae]